MKKQLRQKSLNRRASLTKAAQEQAVAQLSLQLQNNQHCQKANKIGLYSAVNNELDLSWFFKSCLQQNKSCYFPVCKDQTLLFKLANEESSWRLNQFGILEPENSKNISIERLDCLILPCVACDLSNFRLGYGSGYYDRSLANIKKSPWTIIVAYDFQLYDSICPDSWDVPCDELCVIKV